MKIKLLILCLFVFPSLLPAQAPPERFKILCYNIRFGEKASLEELAEFIEKEDPDLVALQEVDCRTYRERAPGQHGKDFMTELGFRTGLIPAYGKTIPYKGGYYGIGILSRFPAAAINRIYLPMTENGKEQRAVLIADIEYKEGEYITFASTHLDYVNSEERQLQVEKLNKILCQKPNPVIVAGDFNARPEYTEISGGMDDWKRLCTLEPTAPAGSPEHKIDYIFGYPKDKWTIIEAATPQIGLSDHLPVSVIVELIPD